MKPVPKESPKTFPEAVNLLVSLAEPDDRDFILKHIDGHGSGMTHHPAAQYLRNHWDLWKPLAPLVVDFQERFRLFGHADDITGLLMHCMWNAVAGRPWAAAEQADLYRRHWQRVGLDPETGEDLKPGFGG